MILFKKKGLRWNKNILSIVWVYVIIVRIKNFGKFDVYESNVMCNRIIRFEC